MTELTRWRGAGRHRLPTYPPFPPAAARQPGELPTALPPRAGNNRCEEGRRPSSHRQDEHRFFLGGLRPPKPSHRVGVWGNPVSPYPCSRAEPSRGRGCGETRFPHTPTPAAYVHVRRSCAWRTTPDEHGLGARASRPRRGSAGTVTAPSRTLPRWGREPGSSPQRGEAGRGAERGERWSPQPSMRLRRTPTG